MTSSTVQQPTRPSARRRWFGWRPDQQSEAYLFLLPSFLGFFIFVALPVLASLGLSFVEWNLIRPPEFVGLTNYRQLLTRDPVFWKVIWNTVYFIVTIVPLQLALGLAIAVALNQAIRGMLAYRVIYFMPVVTTIVAGAIVFQFMLSRDFGIISRLIWDFGAWSGLGIQPPDFLGSTRWSKPSVVMLTIWKMWALPWSSTWRRCKGCRKNSTMRPMWTAPARGSASATSPGR
ncbi:MAG: sugar ABC transporter permease [Caldilineaceae bacterium]|nr:sugar ABC transporter permease [Caldilineaceae bacterium]